MTDLEFSSEFTTKLIHHDAKDDHVVQAAQVSSKGENKPDTIPERLIQALMKGRHGSPFEHNSMTFFVEAPIFVFREWHRHRIASINEMSGRYTVLPGKFYIPARSRKINNVGTKMKPVFEPGTDLHHHMITDGMKYVADTAWDTYQSMLRNNVATEVARMVLPVNIYSQMYWTVNARALMNFLSLRVGTDESLVRSYPQYEIDQPARQIEEIFKELMPLTHKAFVNNGRVAP